MPEKAFWEEARERCQEFSDKREAIGKEYEEVVKREYPVGSRVKWYLERGDKKYRQDGVILRYTGAWWASPGYFLVRNSGTGKEIDQHWSKMTLTSLPVPESASVDIIPDAQPAQ